MGGVPQGTTMRFTPVIALCLFLFTGWVLSDQPPASGYAASAHELLLENQSVQKELKLSEEQIQRIKATMRDIRVKAQKENRSPKTKEQMRIAGDEALQAVNVILKSDQLKRLKQIKLQQENIDALVDPEASKVLKLTDEQKTKVQAIQEELDKEINALFKPGSQVGFQAALTRRAILRRDSLDKGLALLDADQMKAWAELAGEPFELKLEPYKMRPPTVQPGKSGGPDKK